MREEKIYVFDVDYKTIGSNTIVEVFGIDDDKNFKKIEDDSFKPYFIAKISSNENIEKIKGIAVKYKGDLCRVVNVEKSSPMKFLGRLEKDLYKVECNIPNAVKKLRDYLKELKLIEEDYESDIPFYRRYMIDKNVIPLKELIFDKESKRFLEGEKILTPKELRILSLDIEVFTRHGYPDPKKDPIIAISLFDGEEKKLLILKNLNKEIIEKYEFVECVSNERQLLKKFIDFVKRKDPHIILTYNGDNFDFKYIKQRASNLGLSLDIGINSEELKFVRRGREFSAKIPGRIHIDLFRFISTVISPSLKTPVLTLDAVASELLGEKKLEIDWDLFMTEWIRATNDFLENFINYTIRDAILTYKLGMRFLDFIFELSRILLLPPFDVCRFSFSSFVDQYLMKNSKKYNELIPRKPSDEEIKKRLEVSYEGAFVYSPKPGLYENVVVFDFRSLYPSIIITFNISPDTLNREECKNNCYKTPPIEKGGKKITYWFCKSPKGFIPGVLEEVYKERIQLKKKLKSIDKNSPEYKILDSKQQALKTILNATYGYMGYPQARFYSLECAEAITAFGREFIKKTIEFFEKKGFKVIYSDTDSLFLHLGNKDLDEVFKLLEEWNNKLPGCMELEFDKLLKRIIFIEKKSGKEGAKKKYAACTDKNEIIIKGFEAIRRDWAEIVKEAQKNILNLILVEGNVEKAKKYVEDLIKKIKNYEVPVEKFVIYEKLTKDIDKYEQKGPHVHAAMKLKQYGYRVEPGFIIRYIICKGGGSISDRAYPIELVKRLNLKYDPNYYIQNQLYPAIERIFEALNVKISGFIGESKQKTLFDFLK